jgi:hypothetical protein
MLNFMSRTIFAAFAVALLARAGLAQGLPGRDLLEFPVGALAEPRGMAGSLAASLWNPARVVRPGATRVEAALAALTTPIEQGVDARTIAVSGALNDRFTLGLSFVTFDVSDIVRTSTDPQSIGGDVPYRTTILSAMAGTTVYGVDIGAALRRRAAAVDTEQGSHWATDVGISIPALGPLPVHVAASTFMATPGDGGREPTTTLVSARVPLWRRDSTVTTSAGAGWARTSGRADERQLFAATSYRTADATLAVVQTTQFGATRTAMRLGLGLQYARYRIGVAREDGGAGIGASYQFLLSSAFK